MSRNMKKPNAERLGKALVLGRQKLHLTQQQAADKLLVSNKTVSKWECGRGIPDSSLYPKIEELFGFSVWDFCDEEVPADEPEAVSASSSAHRRPVKWILLGCIALLLTGALVLTVCLLFDDGGQEPQYQVTGNGVFLLEAEQARLSEDLIIWTDAGSGSGYVGNFDFHDGTSMEFRFYSDADREAELSFSLVPRGINDLCNDTYEIVFNGERISSRAVFRGWYSTLVAFTEYPIATISLREGENVLKVTFRGNSDHNNGHNFDYIKLNTRIEPETDLILEAEESEHTAGLETYYDAGSGLGYLGRFDENDGASLTFSFSAKEGNYAMYFALNPRGINDPLFRTYTILLNGDALSPTGCVWGVFEDWTDFREYFVDVVRLHETNVLSIVFHSNRHEQMGMDSNNGHNFDYLRLIPDSEYSAAELKSGPLLLEAEDSLRGEGSVRVSVSGGTSYLSDFDGSDEYVFSFLFHADAPCAASLIARLVPRGIDDLFSETYEVRVNGQLLQSDTVISGAFTSWEDFVEYPVGDLWVKKGYNEIRFVFHCNPAHNNGHNFDWIEVQPKG